MTSWIKMDERLKLGLKVLEQIENSKLRLLINRICQALKNGDDKNIFSKEEEEKLTVSLNLEKSDLLILLQSLVSIYSQAAFHMMKSNDIENSMKEFFSLNDDKIAILTHAWITHCDTITDAFKKKSIFPCQIKDVSWTVDVQTSSTALAKDATPVAKIQLITNKQDTSKITVEMNKTQLLDLHKNLNDIHLKLESLRKKDQTLQ
ncbi:COMM domain-containing protein 10-like [Trichogramma pretiosum]|uniref:COMM domain-containing protein 10-like n=1 Tax=Trichogramma pretiosum TaxID=7493 RepID=UPI0006C9CAC7|nr:COMM domain-containing protein 10-like [Trichogramma pretiosum]